MRLIAACALALMVAACSEPATPPRSPEPEPSATHTVNPARIDRARDAMPDGYEVTGYAGAPVPFGAWGFRDSTQADPVQCAALGAPSVAAETARGWSASGPGGIVYAVVAEATPPQGPDPVVLDECRQWTVTSGHTSGTVTAQPGPDIDAAQTVAMRTALTTIVEGGTETHTHADTAVAYLGTYLCFVVVVTDPGSPHPTLGAEFASDLLAETVSTLRG